MKDYKSQDLEDEILKFEEDRRGKSKERAVRIQKRIEEINKQAEILAKKGEGYEDLLYQIAKQKSMQDDAEQKRLNEIKKIHAKTHVKTKKSSKKNNSKNLEEKVFNFAGIMDATNYIEDEIYQNTFVKEERMQKRIGNYRYEFYYQIGNKKDLPISAREFDMITRMILSGEGEYHLEPIRKCKNRSVEMYEREAAGKLITKGFATYLKNESNKIKLTRKIMEVSYTIKTVNY